MLAGIIGTVFGIAFTVGLVVLIGFLVARRKATKAGPDARVEFSPRAFRGALLFIGAVALLVWVAVLIAINSELPSWVFSFGIVFLLAAFRPAILKMTGGMFVVSAEGKQASPAHYPPADFMTGETASAQYGAPAAATAGGAPEPAARPGVTKKPLTRRRNSLSGRVDGKAAEPAETGDGTPG